MAIDDISDVRKKQASEERHLKTHGTSFADAMGLTAMAQCAQNRLRQRIPSMDSTADVSPHPQI
ncbi:MAG: hypothetical protein ACK6BG_12670 [Cyanobacteriota bacterium]